MNRGTSIQAKADFVPKGSLRPLRDQIVLKPLEWTPSDIIQVVREGRPLRGKVVAVGPGDHHKKYSKDRKSFVYSKIFTPTEVKPGDTVELGGLNIYDGRGYMFKEVVIGREMHLICSEKNVCGVING